MQYHEAKKKWKKSEKPRFYGQNKLFFEKGKGDVMQYHEQKKSEKKVKNQDFMGKTNYFLRTLPFSPWAVWATWLHVGAP
jgi:hypothetical protein